MDIKSERLTAALRDSGLTQAELCKRADISEGALSSYLSGRYYPKQKTLERLAAALNVSIIYLMGLDGPSSSEHDASLSPDEALLIEKFRSLNDIGKREALKRVDELTQIERYIKIQDHNSEVI